MSIAFYLPGAGASAATWRLESTQHYSNDDDDEPLFRPRRARQRPRAAGAAAGAGPHEPDAPVRPPPGLPRPPSDARHHPVRALHLPVRRRAVPRRGHLRRLRRGRHGRHGPSGVLPPSGVHRVRDARGGHRRRGVGGRPPAVVVYDPHMPWARRVASDAGVPTAAFLSQACAVDLIYGEVWAGRAPLPMADGSALRRRDAVSVGLGAEDLPPFVVEPELYPQYLKVSIRQFDGLELAGDVFINSFRDLEPLEAEYMETTWRAKTIGPALPSFYLDDGRLPSNKTHGVSFFSGGAPVMEWLEKQAPCSVVLSSFGTVYTMDGGQLGELGNGLCNSGKPFIWVLRSTEAHKLSQDIRDKCEEKGLVVPWCPQLEVLAHKATGCFLTHCGWNSTTEAIVTGVPMVAMPLSADQPTNAKYVESAWGIGVRMQLNEKGLLKSEEVERCIREVMEGERKTEYRQNSVKWMEKAKEAMQEGGSSDKNIAEFAAKYLSA